jgi:hypothetical protein
MKTKIIFSIITSALVIAGTEVKAQATIAGATGNTLTGTVPNPNEYIGSKTGNAFDVVFKANGTERMRIIAATGNIQTFKNPILLSNDTYHGIAYADIFTTTGTYANYHVDGPIAYGYSGGALGSNTAGSKNIALNWLANGNVGIGVQSPSTRLEVGGAITINTSTPAPSLILKSPTAGVIQTIEYYQANVRKAWIGMSAEGDYVIKKENGGCIFLDGGIVRVNNKLIATEINVKTNVWADYVFGNDYKLKTTDELEKFITINKHLPNIPSAAEVEKQGVDLGTMNAKLLEKIEELTLYMLSQQKQITAQQVQIKTLEEGMSALKKN